jgi:uncharacterized protein
MSIIATVKELEAIYGEPNEASTVKRSVVVMTVDEIYFQCARAIVRSDLWNPDKRVDPASLPTPGLILAGMSENRVGGEEYDRAWPERARQSLW